MDLAKCTNEKSGLNILQIISKDFEDGNVDDNINIVTILSSKNWCLSFGHVRFLINITVSYLKKGLLEKGCELLNFSSEVVKKIQNDDALQQSSYLSYFYSILWNVGLKVEDKKTSLTVQKWSLNWLCLSGQVSKSMELALRICAMAESQNMEVSLLEDFVAEILDGLTEVLKKERCTDVRNIQKLLMVYAKYLVARKKRKTFSKCHDPIMKSLSKVVSPDIILTFQVTLKLTEYVMALATGSCTRKEFLDALEMSSHAKISAENNKLIMDFILFIFCPWFYNYPSVERNFCAIFCSVVPLLKKRFQGSLISEPVKIADVISKYFSRMLKVIQNSDETLKKLQDFSLIIAPITSFLSMLDGSVVQTQIYNIGVELCNLGVLCYTKEEYRCSGYYVYAGLQYLCVEFDHVSGDKQVRTKEVISKKCGVLRDAYRYRGHYLKSMEYAIKFYNKGFLHQNELVTAWTKCKRDACKAQDNSLKSLCMEDVVKKYPLKEEVNVYKLLYEEVKQLQYLSCLVYNTYEDQMTCSKVLLRSDDIIDQVYGHLFLCRVCWYTADKPLSEEKPIDHVTCAQKLIVKYKQESDYKHAVFLELQGYISFWTYLCLYQILQSQIQDTVDNVSEESTTVKAQDTGNQFAVQEAILRSLHDALTVWKEFCEGNEFADLECGCDCLLTIGWIFKLCALEEPSLEAFALVVSISKSKPQLKSFWVQGLIPLLLTYSQHIKQATVDELQEFVDNELASNRSSTAMNLTALCCISHYYYEKRKFKIGASLVMKCLEDPYLSTNTVLSTEAHVLALMVYSKYCLCYEDLLDGTRWKRQSAMVPALGACRKSSGLVVAQSQSKGGHLQDTYRITWLYLTSVDWLSKLSYETAQPRLQKGFLLQTLNLSGQLLLPIRTAKNLCASCRFDVLCEDFDDLRTRADCFSTVIRSHNYPTQQALKEHCTAHFLKVLNKLEKSQPDDYTLQPVSIDGVVIGHEDRISYLADPGQALSPSIVKKKITIKECRCPDMKCHVCTAFVLDESVVDTCLAMARMYAIECDRESCLLYLKQVQKVLKKMKALASDSVERFLTQMKFIGICNDVKINTFETDVLCVELRALFHEIEILCIMNDFEGAQNKNTEALRLFTSLPDLTPCRSIEIPKILVQRQLIDRALSKQTQHIKEPESEESFEEYITCETPPKPTTRAAPAARVLRKKPKAGKKVPENPTLALEKQLKELNLDNIPEPIRSPKSKVPVRSKSKENSTRPRRHLKSDSSPVESKKSEHFGRTRRTLKRL